jgi:hypothetical protein
MNLIFNLILNMIPQIENFEIKKANNCRFGRRAKGYKDSKNCQGGE